METNFFSDFEGQTKESWKERLRKDLKGEDPDQKLVWESIEGIKVPAFFHQEDAKKRNETPGSSPYRRGTRFENNEWGISDAYVVSGNEKQINTKMIQALVGGVNRLEIHIQNRVNINLLLKDIQLDIIESQFWVNDQSVEKELLEWLKQNYDLKGLQVSILSDAISENLKNGHAIDANTIASVSETVEEYSDYPFLGLIGINAKIIGETGGNAVEELAYALANAHEHIHQLSEVDDIDGLSKCFRVHLSSGRDFFMEMAKYRAMRLLWASLIKAFNPKENCSLNIHISASTNPFYYTSNDKYNNILRATTGVFAAASGGANNVRVEPFDELHPDNEEFVRRISRNVQHILQQESYLSLVADPMGGSYLVEYLTDELVKNAWELFQDIENDGGLINTLNKGNFQQRVTSTRNKRIDALNDKSEIVLGVNEYQSEDYQPEKQLSSTGKSDLEPLPPLRWSAFYENV